MATKIGINGFGRIGRQVLKGMLDFHEDDLEVVALNDLTDPDTNAHLFKYDTNYGRYPGDVSVEDGSLVIDGNKITVLSERDPAKIAWGDYGVRSRGGVDRHLHEGGAGQGSPGQRAPESDHLGARFGRGPHGGAGRQR